MSPLYSMTVKREAMAMAGNTGNTPLTLDLNSPTCPPKKRRLYADSAGPLTAGICDSDLEKFILNTPEVERTINSFATPAVSVIKQTHSVTPRDEEAPTPVLATLETMRAPVSRPHPHHRPVSPPRQHQTANCAATSQAQNMGLSRSSVQNASQLMHMLGEEQESYEYNSGMTDCYQQQHQQLQQNSMLHTSRANTIDQSEPRSCQVTGTQSNARMNNPVFRQQQMEMRSSPVPHASDHLTARSRHGGYQQQPIDMHQQETMKLERKRERNRVAAQRCRLKKLTRIEELEREVNLLQDKIKKINSTNTLLEDENRRLRSLVQER